jgi:hypothetical protein
VNAPRSVSIAALVVMAILFAATPATRPGSLLRDFNAFYCAGWSAAHHDDPYRTEPLGTCERSAPRPAFLERAPGYMAIPAPLPGYALAPFALLALLPYGIAAALWALVVLTSVALTVVWMRSLTSLSMTTIVAALALSDGYVGLTLGQIAPVAVAALVGCALALQREKIALAACGAAIATIEPHVGLPVCIALALFRPKALAPLALFALAFIGLSVALLGWTTNLEYLASVLPAHGLSEVNNVKQLSWTYLLHRWGVAAPRALQIAEAAYAAMIAAGIALARLLANRTGRQAFLLFVPVALAMVGAPFSHIAQIAAVLPAALLLLDTRRTDAWCIATVVLLAIPWPQFASLGTTFPLLAALTAAALAFELVAGQARITIALVAGVFALCAASAPTFALVPVLDPAQRLQAAYDGHALAESGWSAYVNAVGTQNRTAYDIGRAPTWLGLLLLCYRLVTAAISNRKPRY